LHKGVSKDHTVKWSTACVDGANNEVDRHFKAMLPHPDLRHFKRGISLILQWTGDEYKNMEKIFVGVVAGAADPEVVHATHTKESLTNLEDAWEAFHKHKAVFIKQGIRKLFNILKLHSMIHYVQSIQLLGSADGYNTEGPKRLHIDFAKLGYRASNCKQYVQQMTAWLEHQEAVRHFEAYLDWLEVSQWDAEEIEDSSDNEEPEDNVEIEEIEESEMVTQGSLRTTHCTYKIAKKPPFP
ncbi:hypothetical protein PHLCEN_2v9490, partial [Hermanssonia centrifuga]